MLITITANLLTNQSNIIFPIAETWSLLIQSRNNTISHKKLKS